VSVQGYEPILFAPPFSKKHLAGVISGVSFGRENFGGNFFKKTFGGNFSKNI